MLHNRIVHGKYRTHKSHAKKRGIKFCLTFEVWVRCWEGALGHKWLEKRGPRRGQYVMSRKRDEGPYAIGNVEIILHEHNSGRDQRKNGKIPLGEARSHTKLTKEQVIKIFYAEGSYRIIASKYNISKEHVYDVKARRTWKYLTSQL